MTTPRPDLLEQVVNLIAEETSTPRKRLLPNARLFHDLGVDGIDAEELMQKFFYRFGVAPQGFHHSDYFGPEGNYGLFNIPLWIRNWWTGALSRIPAITPAHLARCAEERKWFPPPMPDRNFG